MKQNLDCRIVEDLLPNYIEELTNEETNKAVDEHLDSCQECSRMLETMKAEISDRQAAPEKEFKFLKKMKRSRIIAAVSCILIAVSLAYLIYASEFTYTNDKNALSTAITEYSSQSGHSVDDAYVLETKEREGVLIAFFRDNSNPEVYGFGQFSKGVNNRYRIISVNFGPTTNSAVIDTFEFTTGSGRYLVVGGHNMDENIDAYGFAFVNQHGDREQILSYEVSNIQFLHFIKESDINEWIQEQQDEGERGHLSPFALLLDDQGNDITENYSIPSERNGWSSGTYKAELFMLYGYMAIILLVGGIFSWYFWSA